VNARAAAVFLATSAVGVAMQLGGCADDGGGSADTTASSISAGDTGSGPGGSGTSIADSGSGEGGTSTAVSSSADDTGGSTEGPPGGDTEATTGLGVVPIDLSNDAWGKSGAVFFQGGFAMGECWASTFVPEPEHYPFDIIGARMVVGGEDAGSADFSIAIWSVDDDGQPLEELSVGTANISGDDDALDTVPLDAIGVQVPTVTRGEFALVVCFTEHGGFPGIAADGDGLTHASRNWIRLEDGTWTNAADQGVSGDWIVRATILPQVM
jgi:hypothetical protein